LKNGFFFENSELEGRERGRGRARRLATCFPLFLLFGPFSWPPFLLFRRALFSPSC
jgi:hypothetical protein